MKPFKHYFFLQMIFLVCLISIPQHLFADFSDTNKFILPEYSKRISMDFKGADLENVLKIFSQQSGMNFIASQDIASKTITLYLNDVPVEEALERILSAHNLTYELESESQIFIVKPLETSARKLETHVYPLKYATVTNSKLNNTFAIEGVLAPASGTGIITAVRDILSSFGKLVEDASTNSLIITDIPEQFPIIESTINKLDVSIPLILIEVEMLDVSKNTSELMGNKFGTSPLKVKGATRQDVFPWNRDSNYFKPSGPVFTTPEFTAAIIDFSGLAITLDFLKSQTDTKSLARPRILTLNNETAQIKISTDEAIGISTNTGGGESGAVTTSVEAERFKTGVFLTVTPQANTSTREIKLAIAPKVIEAKTGGTFVTPGGISTTFKDPEERGTQSILLIRDGDTIILGGLLRHDNNKITTKLPFLSDIPVLGSAFRHKDNKENLRELMIFITPHILQDYSPLDTSTEQIKKLVREQDIPATKENEIEKALSVFKN